MEDKNSANIATDAADKLPEHKHSRALFMDDEGKPMIFTVRAEKLFNEVRSLIEHGGGKVSRKCFINTGNIYRLVEPNAVVRNDNCFSYLYISNCVEKNSQLDINEYHVKPTPESLSEISELDDAHSLSLSYKARPKRIGNYSRKEDKAILDFIICHGRHAEVKGIKLWKTMEHLGNCGKRTYQSMKERFLKRIYPEIHTYNLAPIDVRKFKATMSNEKHSDDNWSDTSASTSTVSDSKRRRFNLKEDKKILKYIVENSCILETKGNTVWKQMQYHEVTAHSWQAMKERFKKCIVNNLENFDLPKDSRNLIESYCISKPKVINKFIKTRRSEMINESPSKSEGETSQYKFINEFNDENVISCDSSENNMIIENHEENVKLDDVPSHNGCHTEKNKSADEDFDSCKNILRPKNQENKDDIENEKVVAITITKRLRPINPAMLDCTLQEDANENLIISDFSDQNEIINTDVIDKNLSKQYSEISLNDVQTVINSYSKATADDICRVIQWLAQSLKMSPTNIAYLMKNKQIHRKKQRGRL